LATLGQLADIDFYLAKHFVDQGKLDRSHSLLVECLENVDRVLRLSPRDHTALVRRFHACRDLASVADREGQSAESLGHLERAVADGQECVRIKPDPYRISDLAECRWSLAQSLRLQGNDERARSLILTNLRMLDDVSKHDSDPIIAIWRTLVRVDVHQFRAGSSSAPASRPDEVDALSRLTAPEADQLDPESWAALVAQCLSSSPSAIDATTNIVYRFILHLSDRLAWQRRLVHLDEARRFADRMHALARLLVVRTPARSAAHLALSESFKQMAKNAWKTNDRAAIERNWELAIDAARRALVLDPQDARAASEVADLQKRLDKLRAGIASASPATGPIPIVPAAR
jgi:tetratricopeptide (TPR) repeat protein